VGQAIVVRGLPFLFQCKAADEKQRPAQPLFLEYLFDLANLLLDLACNLFVLALGRQVWIIRGLPGFLFGCAFCFVKLAFDLIRCALFHVVSLVASGLYPERPMLAKHL
jgi:hypothetical protein